MTSDLKSEANATQKARKGKGDVNAADPGLYKNMASNPDCCREWTQGLLKNKEGKILLYIATLIK